MAKVQDIEEPPERLVMFVASVVCFVLGIIVGVFAIVMFGVFFQGKEAEWLKSGNLQDTIVAITAVVGALTGILGVIFVVKTLRATALTLKSQVEMAKGQAIANKLEYQARLTFESLGLTLNNAGNLVCNFGIKNSGRTEARQVILLASDAKNYNEPIRNIIRGSLVFAAITTGAIEIGNLEIKPIEGKDRIPRKLVFHLSFVDYADFRVISEPVEILIDFAGDSNNIFYERAIPQSLLDELGISAG